jgi:hypothetical protein
MRLRVKQLIQERIRPPGSSYRSLRNHIIFMRLRENNWYRNRSDHGSSYRSLRSHIIFMRLRGTQVIQERISSLLINCKWHINSSLCAAQMHYFLTILQSCRSRRFLTGSGSGFWKNLDMESVLVPDLYPDLNIFSAKFLLEIFVWKYALKRIFINQKVKQQRFLKYLWLLLTPNKLILVHLLRPGSGSGPRRLDPDPSKKVQIRNTAILYGTHND